MPAAQLVVLDPGHFHAALILKESYEGVSRRVAVYAPVGADSADYLNRVAQFNTRAVNPTAWELDLHLSPDYLERMGRDRAGNVAVIAGRNRPKMDRIRACIDAGMNALADKPWIIASVDLPRLDAALGEAARRGLVAYDIMTERYEVTSILQRVLVNDPDIFGEAQRGSPGDPAVRALSIHHIMKLVAGQPIRRPAWFFDIAEQGEALADVGTHVVDLVQWTLFPEQVLDYRTAVEFLGARRWPTVLSPEQFLSVTGERLQQEGSLDYYCNNAVDYVLCGIHVSLDIRWNWEAPAGGGDVYEASFRGSRATVAIRQGEAERWRPELYLTPSSAALHTRVRALQTEYPGLAVEERGGEARLVIPDVYRVGHEAHFAQVTRQFFQYLGEPSSLPAWEHSNMLLKYYIAAKGTEIGDS